ncbi:hypothetical protein Droror1_Dr00000868 [Drosera rotundifolia]
MDSPPSTSAPRLTCLKLDLPAISPIFIKGTWWQTHFSLSITDGLHCWLCIGSEEEVRERAAQWDQPVEEYMGLAERYLGFQQPGSVYGFADAGGDGWKRLSWTFEKEGTKLEWRWRCKPSLDSRKTTIEILDFLMDANIRLSEEVVRKTQAFDLLKVEADKCLEQSEKLSSEKDEFESEVYAKFVSVLNSKKTKLRELRVKLSSKDSTAKMAEEEEEQSSDKTEPYGGSNDDDGNGEEAHAKDRTGTSKCVVRKAPCGRKRGSRI